MILRLLATGFGVAAGLALLGMRPGAVLLTRIALAASAATDLFVYLTPYFPSNRAPGETPVYVLVSLTYHILWLAYLFRSKRVRRPSATPEFVPASGAALAGPSRSA